jgi:hypothetical protein
MVSINLYFLTNAVQYTGTQQSHVQNHKKQTIHTRNLRLKQSTALQQKQQPYSVTIEDGQLGRNM